MFWLGPYTYCDFVLMHLNVYMKAYLFIYGGGLQKSRVG